MKNIRCYNCQYIMGVPDDTTETVCPKCGAKLRLAPPAAPRPEQMAPRAQAPQSPAPAPVQAGTQQPVPAPAPAPAAGNVAAMLFNPNIPSYFDGKLRHLIGLNIVCFLQLVFTLFIGTPWVIIKRKKWILKHTIVRGQRLKLTARGSQLIGCFIKWFFLTFFTVGIYALWIPIKYQQWYASHLEFDGDPIPPMELPKRQRKQMEKEAEKMRAQAQKEAEKAAKKAAKG